MNKNPDPSKQNEWIVSLLPQAALSHCVLIHDEFCGCHTGQQQQQPGIQVTWSQETVIKHPFNHL